MNKKHIIEELHLASTGKKPDQLLMKDMAKLEI